MEQGPSFKPMRHSLLLKAVLLIDCGVLGWSWRLPFQKSTPSKPVIDRPVSVYLYDLPHELLHPEKNMTLSSCTYDLYLTELAIPEIVKHRLPQPPKEQNIILDQDDISYDYYLIPQYSTCYYHQCMDEDKDSVEWRMHCRRQTTKYLQNILDHVEEKYPFWDRQQGQDHILVFTWDEASSLVVDKSLKNRLVSSVHLTHLGTDKLLKNFNPIKDISIPVLRDFSLVSYEPTRFETDLADPSKLRPLFAYFRGTIKETKEHGHGIRQWIQKFGREDRQNYYVKEEHSMFYWSELGKARFALCPPGWSSWSPRLFDAIVTGAIPVIISDDWVPPFSGTLLNYTDFTVRIPENQITRLTEILKAIPVEEEARLRKNLESVMEHFVYDLDPFKGMDAFECIYEVLKQRKAKKIQAMEQVQLGYETEDSDKSEIEIELGHHVYGSGDDEEVEERPQAYKRIEL